MRSAELIIVKIDGLRNAIRSKRFEWKCIWFVILLASTCCCVWFMSKSVHEYLKYEVTSTTRLVVETKAVFPTVTICSYNPFYSLFAAEVFYHYDAQSIYTLEAKFKNITGQYMSQDFKKNMTDIDGLLISCTFQGKVCNANDFQFVEAFMIHLNCYRFNSGYDSSGREAPLKTVQSIGDVKVNSLTMELFTGLFDGYITSYRGFSIFIDFADGFDFNLNRRFVDVRPGVGLSISVKRYASTQFNQWPYSYSECTVNADNTLIKPLGDTSLFEQSIKFNTSYTRDTCLYICTQLAIAEACNCTNYFLSNYKLNKYDYCLSDMICKSIALIQSIPKFVTVVFLIVDVWKDALSSAIRNIMVFSNLATNILHNNTPTRC